MFLRNFTYNLKTILRTKESVFWSLLFPILLSTMFYFAFGNLGSASDFRVINIAIVEEQRDKMGSQFDSVLSAISDIDGESSEDDLFHIVNVSEADADELLKEGKIVGYITYDEDFKLVVTGNGFHQSILKSFMDEYIQTSSTVSGVLQENPAAFFKTISEAMKRQDYLLETDASSSEMDIEVNYFYALLAMTCLMGSTASVFEIGKLQANQSPLAARLNVTPLRKFKLFLHNITASIVFQTAVVLIVLAYVIFVLGINFGNRIGYIILTCVMGSITGVFFGTATGVFWKSEGVKVAITVGATLGSSFFAGLMILDMKYLVQKTLPVIRYLSPANLISDAFYSLYYYDDLSRFFTNIIILAVMSISFCVITCLVLRRKDYANI